jgi:phage anti-repressor protein
MTQEITDMLLTEFTTEDHQIFLTNFKLYLAYDDDSSDEKVIDLDHVWEWMGFARKDIAKRTLQNNFELDTEYSVLRKNAEDVFGGHNKETIMITVDAFKEMCMMSKTEKGKLTRKYYTKMEKAIFRYNKLNFIEKIKNKEIEYMEETKKKEIEFEKKHHKTLIDAHHKSPCVYLCRVSPNINGEYLMKGGETDDILARIRQHVSDFDECVLLDVIASPQAHALEQHVFKRPDIDSRRLPGMEVFEIDKDFTCNDFASIIRKCKSEVEMISFSVEERMLKSRDDSLIAIFNTDMKTETKEELARIIIESHRNAKHSPVPHIETERSRRVYKYAPDNLTTPVDSFMSLREAARTTGDTQLRDYHIRDAASTNTIVALHRWFIVDETPENIDMNPPESIPDTFVSAVNNKKTSSLIAQISEDKSHVINVYQTTNDAATALGTKACNITIAKQKNQKSKGFFWTMWDDLDQALKDTYTAPIPDPFKKKTCSKGIQKICPTTKDVVEEFDCFQDVANMYRICHKKLNQLCKSGDIYKGFTWRLKKNVPTPAPTVLNTVHQPEPTPPIVESNTDDHVNPMPVPTETTVVQTNRRVYKYSLDNLDTPVSVYNSLREAARSTPNTKLCDYNIRDACKSNMILEDHRWFCVDKSKDNQTMSPPNSIPPTSEPIGAPSTRKIGVIAKICPDSSNIVQLFPSVNDAASSIGLGAAAVSFALHHNTRCGNFIWKMFDECNQDQRLAFDGPVPAPISRRTCSKPITQIDPTTKAVVEVHDNQQAVAAKFKICAKKLNQLCASGDIYKGYIWRSANSDSLIHDNL